MKELYGICDRPHYLVKNDRLRQLPVRKAVRDIVQVPHRAELLRKGMQGDESNGLTALGCWAMRHVRHEGATFVPVKWGYGVPFLGTPRSYLHQTD